MINYLPLKKTVFVFILIAGIFLSLWPLILSAYYNEDQIACTMDAMECPDGSYVGRSGPNCEFVCPDQNSPIKDPVSSPSDKLPPAPIIQIPKEVNEAPAVNLNNNSDISVGTTVAEKQPENSSTSQSHTDDDNEPNQVEAKQSDTNYINLITDRIISFFGNLFRWFTW